MSSYASVNLESLANNMLVSCRLRQFIASFLDLFLKSSSLRTDFKDRSSAGLATISRIRVCYAAMDLLAVEFGYIVGRAIFRVCAFLLP